MGEFVGYTLMIAAVIWYFYMITFRYKDYKQISDDMRDNARGASNVAGKAAGFGFKVLTTILKK